MTTSTQSDTAEERGINPWGKHDVSISTPLASVILGVTTRYEVIRMSRTLAHLMTK